MFRRHNEGFIKKITERGHTAFNGFAVGEFGRRNSFAADRGPMDPILVKIFAAAFTLSEVLTHPGIS